MLKKLMMKGVDDEHMGDIRVTVPTHLRTPRYGWEGN